MANPNQPKTPPAQQPNYAPSRGDPSRPDQGLPGSDRPEQGPRPDQGLPEVDRPERPEPREDDDEDDSPTTRRGQE